MKTLSLIAALFIAAPASAQSVNWNGDVMAGFKTMALHQPAPAPVAGKAVSAQVQTDRAERIVATRIGPVTPPIYMVSGSRIGTSGVEMVLNNDKDRVGAIYWKCDGSGEFCEYEGHHFPQLRYDAAAKGIFLGDEKVASVGSMGVKVRKPFKLKLGFEETKVDTGFDRATIRRAVVYLER